MGKWFKNYDIHTILNIIKNHFKNFINMQKNIVSISLSKEKKLKAGYKKQESTVFMCAFLKIKQIKNLKEICQMLAIIDFFVCF